MAIVFVRSDLFVEIGLKLIMGKNSVCWTTANVDFTV